MRLIPMLSLAAALVAGCEKETSAAPPDAAVAAPASSGTPCAADEECVGAWTPSASSCGSIERCFDGTCTLPPAVTGAANAETGRIHFAVGDGEAVFDVEVQNDRFETARGMMCRERMAAGWGMLFFMRETRPHRFWMKNTLIPLDMVFIGDDWKVAGVVANATPKTLISRGVSAPSRYVLELKGGAAAKAGIAAGTQARFEAPAVRR